MNRTAIPYIKNKDGSQGYSWNLFYGCQKCSPGCDNCWALEVTKRFQKNFDPQGVLLNEDKTEWSGRQFLHNKTFHFKPNKTYAINFMNDILLKDGLIFHCLMYDVEQNPESTFICCTKRPQNINLISDYNFPNLWLGLTICTQAEADEKIPIMLEVKRKNPLLHIWLSIEPMLDAINLYEISTFKRENNLDACYFDWIVVGGESGSKARGCSYIWVKNIKDFCLATQTPFYFKQWDQMESGKDYKIAEIDGKKYKALPYLRKGVLI